MQVSDFEGNLATPEMIDLIRRLYSIPFKLLPPLTVYIKGSEKNLTCFLEVANKVDPCNLGYEDIIWITVDSEKDNKQYNDQCNDQYNKIYLIDDQDYNDQYEKIMINYI